MAIRVQRHAHVSKQATLLDGLDVSPLKWRVCGCGLHRFVHEGMNHISNVDVHLKTRSGNVNITKFISKEILSVCLTYFCDASLKYLYIQCLRSHRYVYTPLDSRLFFFSLIRVVRV